MELRKGRFTLSCLVVSVDRMNLWEVADFLKKNGVINAINLDGGGSSTFVVGGSLASYPSDHWLDPPFFTRDEIVPAAFS